ncbi:hypothetical protein DM860_014284 [Cuscuta australis]|uniref:SEC7 domain-containing protein n=1 Tax=Cuscuta australis TaxID=267555 RepID=A0A328DIE1_9ASTE|nr:hypothetical protein DM860_014284 [Cuscuta australis]
MHSAPDPKIHAHQSEKRFAHQEFIDGDRIGEDIQLRRERMSGGGAGAFLTRSLESMLKECSSKKYSSLQTAIHKCLVVLKASSQQTIHDESNFVASKGSEQSSLRETNAGSEGTVHSIPTSPSKTILTALAHAGDTLSVSEAELVLNPLRLAFETKNVKIVELGLDCLHKLIAYDHLDGDLGFDGLGNGPPFSDILGLVCSCVDNVLPDGTTLQVLKVLLTAVASTKFRVHGEPLLGVIRACYSIALKSKSPINQATSKSMLTQMLSMVFKRMEADGLACKYKMDASSNVPKLKIEDMSSDDHNKQESMLRDKCSANQTKDAFVASLEELYSLVDGVDIKGLEDIFEKAVQLEEGGKHTGGRDLGSTNIGLHDALILFHSLCKMATKEKNGEPKTETCILSLELLQGLLEEATDSFTLLLDSVKAHISYTLLQASVSQSLSIFQYATRIFSILLLRYRQSLKGEIGVLFPLIVLRTLGEQDLNLKTDVLRMLEKVCKDSQILVDLYVNYDCELKAPNLFEHMVTTLSRIVQGAQNADMNSAASSLISATKMLSLQCLVTVLRSLVEWENCQPGPLIVNQGKQSFEEGLSGKHDDVTCKETLPCDFEKMKAHESPIEVAVSEFNRQSSKGIEYLISSRLVERSPASVAQFLRNTPNLDKAMIGEYLSLHEEFPLAVMHAYVESMNFSGVKFDKAIRELFRGLQLPGDSRKIDRILEKFAECYCVANTDIFKHADTAYALAYAVILLNTDAHSPMVWQKMSKDDFVRMIVMQDDDDCALKELLEEIYDCIVVEEIKMEERGQVINILNLSPPRKKYLMDSKAKSKAINAHKQSIIKNQGGIRRELCTSYNIALVCPMVEAVGWPLLATLAVTMEEGENHTRITLCMEGFKAGIHTTHVLGLDTMRCAFLTSLIKFNMLHSPRDMRSKNLEALQTLLVLCDSDTNALQDTWYAVLETVSRLEYVVSSSSLAANMMQGSNQISRDFLILSLRDLAGQPAERVFMNSAKLPSDLAVEFVTALCDVSVEELREQPARLFSLEKLVNISYCHMARIRMVWARISVVLANHLIFAGNHPDERVNVYAMDSLKQLGIKCLECTENSFKFQNDILHPFVTLMRDSKSESMRKHTVDCVVQIIKSKAASIKSGWKSVFMIFAAAAEDAIEPIVEIAFENVEQVIVEHFDRIVGNCFVDCVSCLVGFAKSMCSHRISLKAIALIRICEDRLAEGFIASGALESFGNNAVGSYRVREDYWFPILAGLSALTSDPRPEVKNCALEVLFDLLNERGSKFSSLFWERIFHHVLFPIFYHAKHDGEENPDLCRHERVRENSIHSLQLLCNLFCTFYKVVSFMLPTLLSLLLDCAKKADQQVVSVSLGALVHLIEVGGHQFGLSDWDTLLQSISDASYTTQPLELLNDFGFRKANDQTMPTLDSSSSPAHSDTNISASTGTDDSAKVQNALGMQEDSQGRKPIGEEESEGMPSPSGRALEPTLSDGFQQSQTIGQKIMGNVMENLFIRSFTSKSKSKSGALASPPKISENLKPDARDENESSVLETVRNKCITQLLLLGAIDNIQKKYWNKLKTAQKTFLMDILLSLVEFAASYNSYSSLRLRTQQLDANRPPLNIIRQELAGTSIYLDMLHKSTAEINDVKDETQETCKSQDADLLARSDETSTMEVEEDKLQGVAEQKLVLFCGKILREASEFQSSTGDVPSTDVHQVLELRSPITVMVLKGMSHMNTRLFRSHLKEFYPLITQLMCCDQKDVRGALADLLSMQIKTLLL